VIVSPKERCSTLVRRRLVLTCEHGGNRIPARYLPLFVGRDRLLHSHRGYDRGALWLARWLARALRAPLYAAANSRLLIDLNRSLHNPRVCSDQTRRLSHSERDNIVARYYSPHRDRIEQHIGKLTTRDVPVLHIAVHSFTPRLGGLTRNADVGLLYDPRRPSERDFCIGWQVALKAAAPHLCVRRNYPYRGSDDGLTSHLRCRFPRRLYLGVELEINQRHVTDSNAVGYGIPEALINTLKTGGRLIASRSLGDQ